MIEQRQFKKLANRENIDLIPYIKEYMEQHGGASIMVGTDSQNRKHKTVYATCIGLTPVARGGTHIIYTKYEVPRIKENRDRLIQETWSTIETAEYIKEHTGIKASWLDLDINEFKQFKSNEVLAASVGLTEAYDYNSRHKNSKNLPMISYMCDSIVKK